MCGGENDESVFRGVVLPSEARQRVSLQPGVILVKQDVTHDLHTFPLALHPIWETTVSVQHWTGRTFFGNCEIKWFKNQYYSPKSHAFKYQIAKKNRKFLDNNSRTNHVIQNCESNNFCKCPHFYKFGVILNQHQSEGLVAGINTIRSLKLGLTTSKAKDWLPAFALLEVQN